MTPWASSKIHHGYHEKCIIGIIKNASLNSEIVNNQDCHNTNLVLEDNIFKKQPNTKHDCQNMDKFFIAVFPFVIDKYKQNNGILANKRVKETKIFREIDAPPPPYKSMLKVFLMDEPPNYSNATGITVNVNEIAQDQTNGELAETSSNNQETMRRIWFGCLVFLLTVAGCVGLALVLR